MGSRSATDTPVNKGLNTELASSLPPSLPPSSSANTHLKRGKEALVGVETDSTCHPVNTVNVFKPLDENKQREG